ncbi:MAG: DUF2147 domain-containing protein [Sphingomonas sp.]|nr:DUF2147 domain-containing protein [Sphingomonas sp.]
MSRAALVPVASLVGLLAAAPAEARSPIEGRWEKGNMQIEIKPCGEGYCGTVIKASDKQKARARRGSGTELIGATLIRDIKPNGPGRYRARVFVADRNIHATGRIRQISEDLLKVSGCVLAIICRSAEWVRVR